MSKRKCSTDEINEAYVPKADPRDAPRKPLSAVAAARARQLERHSSPQNGSATSRNVTLVSTNEDVVTSGSTAALLQLAQDVSGQELDLELADSSDEATPVEVQERQHWELSTWRLARKKANISTSTSTRVVLFLKKTETLSYVGSYQLRVLKGAVNVCGARLRAGDCEEILAPATHPIPIVYGLSESSKIEISALPQTIAPLHRISPLFRRAWNVRDRTHNILEYEVTTASIVNDTEDDKLRRPLAPLVLPVDWLAHIEMIAASNKPQFILVDGSANSGKSTYCKVIMNGFLSRPDVRDQSVVPNVYLLDLDSSQPEFGPVGQISLVKVNKSVFSPNFCRPTIEDGSKFTMVRSLPAPVRKSLNFIEYYYHAMLELLECFQRQKVNISASQLLINPPTWSYQNTSGLSFFEKLLNALQISAQRARAEFHRLSCPAFYANTIRTDNELHHMQTLSYFHQSRSNRIQTSWSYLPLSFEAPLIVDYASHSERGFIGVLNLGNWISADYLHTVLNGSIVSIVTTSDPNTTRKYGQLPLAGPFQIPYFALDESGSAETLNPSSLQFQCQALVRCIDGKRGALQLLVPQPLRVKLHNLNPRQTILLLGWLDTPHWCYMEDVYYDEFLAKRERKRNSVSESESDLGGSSGAGAGAANVNVRRGAGNWVMRSMDADEFGNLHIIRKTR